MNIRVHQLAKELGLESKELISRIKKLHIEVKGHMSSLDEESVVTIRRELGSGIKKAVKKTIKKKTDKVIDKKITVKKTAEKRKDKLKIEDKLKIKNKPQVAEALKTKDKFKVAGKLKVRDKPKIKHSAKIRDRIKDKIKDEVKVKAKEQAKPAPKPVGPARVIELNFPISVKDLSVKLQVKPNELITALMKEKILVHINQALAEDVVKLIAARFNCEVKELSTTEEIILNEHKRPSNKDDLKPRPPVITLMGHVDHGKTSLLDAVRKSRVVDKEAGAITQHIGAYEVDLDKGKVVFLDTPGHAAFTQMRARGANATDVVVLVVAADDGIMPQTLEAIDHARAAGVPVLVAINKIDLPGADPDRIKTDLQKMDLTPEEWGGETICVEVSAKTGDGIDNFLDMLLLEAEMLELKADPERPAKGVVVEGRLSGGKGVVADILVQDGTLKVGQTIISGMYFGKIKAMIDDKGQAVQEAGPSIPVEVLGLSGVPEAGDSFYVVADEKQAREISVARQEKSKEQELGANQKISLEQLYENIKQGRIKELNLIIKADVQGSVEALINSLEKINTEDVKVKIIHSGAGRINESDVILASVSNAVIIGFHIRPEPRAGDLAKTEKVEIRLYDIIYNIIEEIRKAMEGLLDPELKEVIIGRAKVREIFKVSRIGTIAGCIVEKNKIIRNARIRLIRDEMKIYEGNVKSLKRFKDDAKEVAEGYECGIGIENFNDIKVDDLLECYQIEKIARKLN